MKRVIRAIVIAILSLSYRVTLVGRENIPKKGSALLCGNHNGELDMFFIGYRIKRFVHWMAKEELFRNPILGALLRWLGAFPVKRGTGDIGAIKTSLKLLKEGHIVGIFPEGTRTRGKDKGKIKVKPGAALIAIQSSAPILPVAVKGSYKPFSKIKVVFGKPFNLNIEDGKKYSSEEMSEIVENIMKEVYGLLEEN